MVDTHKLLDRIARLRLTEKDIQERLHFTEREWNRRIWSKDPFSVEELRQLSLCLSIPAQEIESYFFARKVAKCNFAFARKEPACEGALPCARGDAQDRPDALCCSDCGESQYGTDSLTEWDGEYLCDDCLAARVGNFRAPDIAAALGLRRLPAGEWRACGFLRRPDGR